MDGNRMFGSPLGIRKFAREQPPVKVTDRVFPPSPTLAQLNDLSVSGFAPLRDLPAVIAMAREVQGPQEEPTVAAAPAASVTSVPSSPRQLAVTVPVPS